MKKIFLLIKKVILAVICIYAYNKLTLPLNIVIPINIFTISLVTLFGIPSMIMLILFSLIYI